MFLKRRTRSKNGETHEYWGLVRTVRTGSGPRHGTVAYLGRLGVARARRAPAQDQPHPSEDPVRLWKWYVQLTQAESAFRAVKSDLSMRPVFHHKEGRVDAHILVCFLALAMWRTLEQWMETKGLGSCARQFLSEMDKVRSMDVVLPDDSGAEMRLRTVSKPERPLAVLLHRLGLNLPQTPKKIENVVQNN